MEEAKSKKYSHIPTGRAVWHIIWNLRQNGKVPWQQRRSDSPPSSYHERLVRHAIFRLVDEVSYRVKTGYGVDLFHHRDTSVRVRVLDALEYVIDPSKKCVWMRPDPFEVVTGEETHAPSLEAALGHSPDEPIFNVDLLNPLCRPAWLNYLTLRKGTLVHRLTLSHQRELGLKASEEADLLRQVTHGAFARLKHTPEMKELKYKTAITLTDNIGPDLMGLALRSRPFPLLGTLQAKHLNKVWQHRAAFETMGNENPKLLSALAAWLDTRSDDTTRLEDTLPHMRNDLLATGLPPRAWRVLAQHGLHKLLPAQTERRPWATMIETLWSLHHAGWPPVPPRPFIRLLNDVAGRPTSFNAVDGHIPGWYWRMACAEASRLRNQANAYAELSNQTPQHCLLLREHPLQPDANQMRQGLKWLQDQTDTFKALHNLDHTAHWVPWLSSTAQATPSSQLTWEVVQSPGHLLRTAFDFHNCADRYEDACSSERYVLICIRHALKGKRLALVGLELSGGRWELSQVAGPYNKPVSDAIHRNALQALEWVRCLHGHWYSMMEPQAHTADLHMAENAQV